MSDTSDRSRTDEASRWFTQLKRPSVTAQALHDFREWRRDAANAEAFAHVERTWEAAGSLAERPAMKAAADAALAARPPKAARSSRRLTFVPVAVGMASLAIAAGGTVVGLNYYEPTYATDIGDQRLEQLSDGSRVRLNTDTKIRVKLHGAQRRIELLRGEAFFDVAHDATRPFIVETNGAEVRALGTKFEVRRDAGIVRVTLVQGRVEVSQSGQAAKATLNPNETLTIGAQGVTAPRPTDATAESSWTTGRLTFRGAPLRDAVQEVNRYSRRKIVLSPTDPAAAERLSGQFEPGDTETFLAGIEAVYGLKVVSETPHEIRLGRRAVGGG